MTTSLDPQLLLRIHRLLRQMSDLESRLRRCPARATLARKTANDMEISLAATRDTLKNTRMSADQKQLQLSEREARIEDFKIKRNVCESNREYQLLTDQIAADQQANSVQSDEILELLERQDAIVTEIAHAESDLKLAQAEADRVESSVNDESNRLQNELNEVKQEFSDAHKRLPSDVRDTFLRLVDSVGEDALALVDDNNSCGRCNTNQTMQVLSELMLKNAVFCKSCGSLMYFAQNAAV